MTFGHLFAEQRCARCDRLAPLADLVAAWLFDGVRENECLVHADRTLCRGQFGG